MIKRLVMAVTAALCITQGPAACIASRPATYGVKIEACRTKSADWESYIPCCVEVATEYQRDPSFCYPEEESK